MTEWVAELLHIVSHWRDVMVIAEGWKGCLTVIDSLEFTVDTVYHREKKIEISMIYL